MKWAVLLGLCAICPSAATARDFTVLLSCDISGAVITEGPAAKPIGQCPIEVHYRIPDDFVGDKYNILGITLRWPSGASASTADPFALTLNPSNRQEIKFTRPEGPDKVRDLSASYEFDLARLRAQQQSQAQREMAGMEARGRAAAEADAQARAEQEAAAQREAAKNDEAATATILGLGFLNGYNGARATTPPPIFTTCAAPLPGAPINCLGY